MKNILLITIAGFLLAATANAQTTRMEPVPGMPPIVMSGSDFEKLTVPASMFRYGEISEAEKKRNVDLFLSMISPNNKTIEFVIGLNDSSKHLSSDVDWYTEYFKKKKIALERYSFAFGSTRNGGTELWYVPNNNVALPTNPSNSPFTIIKAEETKELTDYLVKIQTK